MYRQWQRLAELGWFQLFVAVPYIIHPMCLVWHVLGGGVVREDGRSSRMFARAIQFPEGGKNLTKPWSAISKSAEIHRSIEDQIG